MRACKRVFGTISWWPGAWAGGGEGPWRRTGDLGRRWGGKGRREERENGKKREGVKTRREEEEKRKRADPIQQVQPGPIRFSRSDLEYLKLKFFSALEQKIRPKNFKKLRKICRI